MKKRESIATLLSVLACMIAMPTASFPQAASVEEALKVPGARVTMPVEAAKSPFAKEFVAVAQKAFNSFHTHFYAIMTGTSGLAEDASLMDAVKMAEKLAEPGEVFEYSSVNTYVVGTTIERITHKPVHELITERIWSKAGMEGDGLLALSPSGEAQIQGMFSSRLRDMARYGMLYTPSWNVVARERVVSENYLSRVYAASRPDIFPGNNIGDRMISVFGDIEMGESYQWDAVFPDGDLFKSGRLGQCLYVSPETDTVVVFFSSAYNNTLYVFDYARQIVETVFRNM